MPRFKVENTLFERVFLLPRDDKRNGIESHGQFYNICKVCVRERGEPDFPRIETKKDIFYVHGTFY